MSAWVRPERRTSSLRRAENIPVGIFSVAIIPCGIYHLESCPQENRPARKQRLTPPDLPGGLRNSPAHPLSLMSTASVIHICSESSKGSERAPAWWKNFLRGSPKSGCPGLPPPASALLPDAVFRANHYSPKPPPRMHDLLAIWLVPPIQKGLADLIRESGHTQAAVCRASGLRTNTLSRYVTGQREPTARHAVSLAKALGVTVEQLVDALPPRRRGN